MQRIVGLERGLVKVTGKDASKFLHGLMTNDMGLLKASHDAMFTAFLSTKGRILFDAFVARVECETGKDTFLLDCPHGVAGQLEKYLKRYRLRSKVKIADVSDDYQVWSVLSNEQVDASSIRPQVEDGMGACFEDPRHNAMGLRILAPRESDVGDFCEAAPAEQQVYNCMRLLHGIPEGAELEGKIPLECNMEFLNAIGFTKGCYVGQELVARTHFKGQVRKRYFPFFFGADGAQEQASSSLPQISEYTVSDETPSSIDSLFPFSFIRRGSAAPEIGATLWEATSGKKAGVVVAASDVMNVGIAQVRLEYLLSHESPQSSFQTAKPSDGEPTGIRVVPYSPEWLPLLDIETGKKAKETE
jgi:folate-binding protein YgfZ